MDALNSKKLSLKYNNKDFKTSLKLIPKTTRNYREFLFFLSLLKAPYGAWIMLPTKQALDGFRSFLLKSKIPYKQVYMKSLFVNQMQASHLLLNNKTNNSQNSGLNRKLDEYTWLPRGGSVFFTFSSLSDFSMALSFFFKDNAWKNLELDFSSKLNLMVGSIISIKLFDFITRSNLSFFSFFINSINFMKFNEYFFLLFFIKTTMVVLYSIMLIIFFFKLMLLRFMNLNIQLFFKFTSYANKKSIS